MDDELVRVFLSMIILFASEQNKNHGVVDLEALKNRLHNATGDDYSVFYLRELIAKALGSCVDEDISNIFEIKIKPQ